MGMTSDKEITQFVCGENSDFLDSFSSSLEEAAKTGICTQSQSLEYVGMRVRLSRKPGYVRKPVLEEGRDALADLVISHIEIDDFNFRSKAIYLCLMIQKVIAIGHRPDLIDDRDYVGNKRLELAGQLMGLLFEDLFKTFCGQVKSLIDKTLQKQSRIGEFDAARFLSLSQNTITEGLFRSLSTGNWSLKRFKMERAGVTQVLSRLSYVSALGMMTRIQSQFEKTRKVSGPRSLQVSAVFSKTI
jgi:DNA-directed RNA polymerase III subunit RPC2